MPMPLATMTVPDAQDLAKRLDRRGTEVTLAVQIAVLETECRMASRLIRAMLRQVGRLSAVSVCNAIRCANVEESWCCKAKSTAG